MYGMIHRGIREMVIEARGESEWTAVEQDAGIGPAELISANVYDDAVTVSLLQTVATRRGQTLAELLTEFGRYWIRFAERGSYGAIMDFTGSDLPSFIGNLDRMHQAVVSVMPQARVPSFALVEQAEGQLKVGYISERAGLEPFVTGLLEGLLTRFDLAGEVQEVARAGNMVEFLVRYEPA